MTKMQHNRPISGASQASGSKEVIKTRDWVERLGHELDEMMKRVSALVRQESPTSHSDAVNAAQETVAKWAEELGARVTRHARGGSAGVLEARFGNPKDERRPVLLLGHLDTVWPMGTLARMPWRVADGWAYGPGVLDMKAGVVMALTRREACARNGYRSPGRAAAERR